MIIKEAGSDKRLIKTGKDFITPRVSKNKIARRVVVISCLLACGYFGFLFIKTGKIQQTILSWGQSKFLQYSPHTRFSDSPRIEIGISEKDFQKIARLREEAIQDGVLVTSSESYVPAKIRYQNKVYRAQIRLKGDWIEHLHGEKWSYRISIKDGETILGMKEFSIQHPARRNYLFGWIFQKVLGREQILALRVKFINVILNEKNLGLYYLEEHFDKLLVEHNRYREGPILKFDEGLLWADRKRHFGPEEPPGAFYSSAIQSFQPKKISSNPVLKEQFATAFNLLARFRTGELSVPQVFDVKKLARYYALSDLFGAYHMAYFHNMRFYYNPVTSLLEPIAFDADAGNPINELLFSRRYKTNPYYDFGRLIFSDEDFVNTYLAEIDRLAQPSYLTKQLSWLKKDLEKNIRILAKEFPEYRYRNESLLYNQQFMLKALNPIKGLHAYLKESTGRRLTLRMANIQSLPIEVDGIAYNDFMIFRPTEEILLPGKDPSRKTHYQDSSFKAVGSFRLNDTHRKNLKLIYHIAGTRYKSRLDIFPWSFYQDRFLSIDFIRQEPNAANFDFLIKDEKSRVIHIKPGEWTLKENLVIPPGYLFVAKEGTTIHLLSSAKILSYSPIRFAGSEDRPIHIRSRDASGQGLVVLNASERSTMEHVVFENLQAPQQNGWALTGVVTFYESPVDIRHCQFINSQIADDFLNIIRSDFTLMDSQFSKAYADAIDLDFATGKIERVTFTKCGNDAMDFSGSVVDLHDIVIHQAMDKGLSAGENSQIAIQKVTVSQSTMAIVSKDSSTVKVKNVDLKQCQIGFAAFQKKSEFGPAHIDIDGLTSTDIHKLYVKEKESQIAVRRK